MDFADGIGIWVCSRRCSYWLDNPMQRLEINALQSRETGLFGFGSRHFRQFSCSNQEMVWGIVSDIFLKVLPLHLWLRKDQTWRASGLLQLSFMGSTFFAHSVLCDRSSCLLAAWHFLISQGMFSQLSNFLLKPDFEHARKFYFLIKSIGMVRNWT